MKLNPVVFVMTWLEEVPVVTDVTVVERGMVITGNAWLRDIGSWANGVSKVGWGVQPESWGLGVAEGALRVELWASGMCGVNEGVLVGVGVDGLGVPDPAHWEK